jgi:UDP-glucose 4-epimerase
VQDTVEAMLRLMATDNAVGEVVNIGTDREITVTALAEMVKARTGSISAVTYTPYDQAYEPGFEDMMRRVPCLDKLERLTGFRPATTLENIIDRVTNHFQTKRNLVTVDRGKSVAN